MRKIVALFSFLKEGYAYFDIIEGDNKGMLYEVSEERSPGFIIFEDTQIGRKILELVSWQLCVELKVA